MGFSLLSFVFTVISIAYQYAQQRAAEKRFKKQQAEAANRAEEAKGFQLTVEGTVNPIGIPYGRALLGGLRAFHAVTSDVAISPPAGDGIQLKTITKARATSYYTTYSSSGKERKHVGGNGVLLVQQVLGYGRLTELLTMEVNELAYNHEDLKNSVCSNVYLGGNFADPIAVAMEPSRSSAVFTDLAYASSLFSLDRDEPQYNGIPESRFFVKGLGVYGITKSGDNYSLTSVKSFSNNPALVLLDYLTNTYYGKGLPLSKINLKSFYDAMRVCDKVVLSGKEKNGKWWSNCSDPRNVKRFEANLTLSSAATHRDNVEKILETMDLSELLWVEGKYKLVLKYPLVYSAGVTYDEGDVVQSESGGILSLHRSLISGNNTALSSGNWAEDVAAVITDDDILREKEFSEMWPSAKDRYNQFTVRFRNESKDFDDDTVTWPSRDSDVYVQFLAEDGGQTLEGDNYEEGITDQWHALARAEQRCRFSRVSAQHKFSLTLKWAGLEPGDLVFLDSEAFGIRKRLLRISEVVIKENGEISVTATRYDARILAWNANDDEYITYSQTASSLLKQASNLTFQIDNNRSNSVGTLSWDGAEDNRVVRYRVYATRRNAQFVDEDTVWEFLGETSNTYFSVQSIPAGSYCLAVASVSSRGEQSTQWSSLTNNRWPFISVGVGAIASGNNLITAQTIYTRTSAIPSKPVGGVFDFDMMVWESTPAGWTSVIPIGAQQLYSSSAIIKSNDPVIAWTDPVMLQDKFTYLEVSDPVLVVQQNADGYNFGYGAASGSLRAIQNNINVTLDAVFQVVSSTNCTVVLGNGSENGKYAVTSLIGDSGYFTLSASYGGNVFTTTISVYALSTGYVVDMTPPPVPSNVDVSVGLNTIFVRIDDAMGYAEGHGHLQTEVYAAAPGSTFEQSEMVHVFKGNYTAIPSPLGTPLQVWVGFRSKDNVLSTPAGPFDATTGKIGSGDIETKAITRALIGDAAIDSAQIADGAIVNAKIGQVIESSNFEEGTAGWSINKDGRAVFHAITVYDNNGNVVLSVDGVPWDAISGVNKPQSGATRNVHRGAWADGTTYFSGDMVLQDGSTWVAATEHVASGATSPPALPTTSNAYWSLMASAGVDGEGPIEVFKITTTAPVLISSGNVNNPSSITFTAYQVFSSHNELYLGRFKVYEDSALVYSSSMDESEVTLSPNSTANSIIVELYSVGGFTALRDRLEIPVLRGLDGITVVVTNDFHVMSADADGVVDGYLGSGTDIRVFEGGTELSYAPGVLGLGQFKIPGFVSNGITCGAIESISGLARVNNHSAMTSDTASITFDIQIRRTNGSTLTVTATQVLSKSKRGRDAIDIDIVIESTNGDVFRVGQGMTTTLIAHVFQNGLDITDQIPASRFRWRRVSYIPQDPPNDDGTWDTQHTSGYKSIVVTATDVSHRATFHCDLLEN